MSEETFEELMEFVEQEFASRNWAPVLERVNAALPRFPEQVSVLNYYRLCLTARLEQYDQTLRVLEEVLDSGVWMSEEILRQSPSLMPLQGRADFEALAARSLDLRARDRAEGKETPIVLEPAGPQPWPWLIALHCNNSNAAAFAEPWKTAQAAGWLTLLPESSQAIWSSTYIWNDQQVGTADVLADYRAMGERYSLDPQPGIIAGHSMGGQLALRLALTDSLPVRGFILLGPYFPEMEGWAELISAAWGRPLRGVVFLGEEDRALPQENVRAVVDLLNAAGIVCRLEMLPGRGHEVPPDFAELLKPALAFVNG
jgi:predicted esterase